MSLLSHYLDDPLNKTKNPAAIAYLASLDHLSSEHPDLAKLVVKELIDQRNNLKMIASENYSSLSVQLAAGNLLTDKYCEGYPFHRFYAGGENVDQIELKAIEELKLLYGAEHAYVQPHSGADANLVAFWSVLIKKVQSAEIEKLGKKNIDELTPEEYEKIRQLMLNQKMLGMSLDSGGHLTHGFKHNVSSKMMRIATYDVDPNTELMDYKVLEQKAISEKPTILIAGYSSYPRLINFAKMKDIADRCGAVLIVDMAHLSGLVAGQGLIGEYNPIPYADIVTSTTHKTLRGPRGGMILCKKEWQQIIDKGCPLVLGGPLPHIINAKAVAFREARRPEFKNYIAQVIKNAQACADRLLFRGVKLFTGGTDNHLVVFDTVKSFAITGKQAEIALTQGGITANRNSIPNDINGAWFTSGIRIGTSALTTRGFKENEMILIADLIADLLSSTTSIIDKNTGKMSRSKVDIDAKMLNKTRDTINQLTKDFPLYPELGEVSLL